MQPTFTFAEAAHAADLPVATLRDWFSTRTSAFGLREGDVGAPAGGVRRLSVNTVVAVALAAALARRGVPLQQAAQAGRMFLYPDGGMGPTILAVDANGNAHLCPAGHSRDHTFLEIIGEGGATFVNASCIYDRVAAALIKRTGANARRRRG